LRSMSRSMRHEKKGCLMIGQATTRMTSRRGNSVPGNEIAAAYAGYSPSTPPTAVILFQSVWRSLQVFAICGLIIVSAAPVSISALMDNSEYSSPIDRPSSNSGSVVLTIMSMTGPCSKRVLGLGRHFKMRPQYMRYTGSSAQICFKRKFLPSPAAERPALNADS
jgi:hypothetical protein